MFRDHPKKSHRHAECGICDILLIACSAMVELALLMSLNSLLSGLRSQAAFQAEIIALRHQLIVPQRTQRPKRLILNRGDRCLRVWLSRFWSRWRSSLIIVKLETVVGWHRQGFRWYWTWKIRHRRPGCPYSSKETLSLIRPRRSPHGSD